jgi:hypothetical protein
MVTVTVAGVDRACDTVSGSLTIGIGRQSVRDKGSPSYLSARIRHRPDLPYIGAFDPVLVSTSTGHRFAGTGAEASLEHDESGAWQTINAVGPLASWGQQMIGEPVWPKETVAARAERIAAIIGEPIVVLGGDTIQVDRQDVDNKRAKELLEELADSTAGFLFDRPTAAGIGTVYLEALGARTVQATAVTWDMEPAAATWDELDPALTWLDEDTNPFRPIELDGCYLRADPGPTWVATTDVGNRVTVEYGDPVATVTVEDPASIAAYGTFDVRLQTPIDNAGDATTLATGVLERAAMPTLEMGAVDIDIQRLPLELAETLSGMAPGARITVTGLRGPAPVQVFYGCVEGWQETYYTGDGVFLRLFLSDVRHSFATPSWDAEPVDATWDDLDPTTTWEGDL